VFDLDPTQPHSRRYKCTACRERSQQKPRPRSDLRQITGAQPDALLLVSEVMELAGIGRSGLYRRMTAGTFPRPVQLGVQRVARPGLLRSRPRSSHQGEHRTRNGAVELQRSPRRGRTDRAPLGIMTEGRNSLARKTCSGRPPAAIRLVGPTTAALHRHGAVVQTTAAGTEARFA
jgi:predicted DNA-binding transcriptional regulator AlpA